MKKVKQKTRGTKEEKKALAVIPQKEKTEISIWSKTDEIRKLFAPTLTEMEFQMFLGLGRALNANPFTREIWAVKYDNTKAASIFCGRDFYRRKAQEQSSYDGHTVEVVYEKDEFKMVDGEPHHSFSLKERGKIIGAYCIVRRKGIKQPFISTVKFEEYFKPSKSGFKNNWDIMPETMIKKVAEAQGLRAAFQGIFAGTYDESEQWQEEKPVKKIYAVETEVEVIDRIPEFFEKAMKRIENATTSDVVIDTQKRAQAFDKFSAEQLAQINSAANARVDQLMGSAS